jgi:hypothetical protein
MKVEAYIIYMASGATKNVLLRHHHEEAFEERKGLHPPPIT